MGELTYAKIWVDGKQSRRLNRLEKSSIRHICGAVA